MTLMRGSLDRTIVQFNQKIIAHQMIQDHSLSHQQREKRMSVGELNTQREDSIFLTLYHLLYGSNTVFTSTIGCRSFHRCVTVFRVHLSTRVYRHMFQSLLIVRSHLQTVTSHSHDCKNMFRVLQTVDFCVEQLDRSIRNGVLCQSTR